MISNFFNLKNPNIKKTAQTPPVTKLDNTKPWIEKYRPQILDEIIYQKSAVETFKGIKKTKKMPHLLLYGPPGTGKTSIILALSKELFGPLHYKARILELNASDDRGINKVRQKIKVFAEKQLKTIPGNVPKFKIIILDEADNMTKEAQQALRRVIEDYSKITRFCIICNYVTKIIEPLKSRCVMFRFKQIPFLAQRERLQDIADYEGIFMGEGACETLIEISKGDLRKSVNLLQLAKSAFGEKSVDRGDFVKISDTIACEDFRKEFLDLYAGLENERDKERFVDGLIRKGFMCKQVINACYDWVLNFKDVESFKKSKLIGVISDIDKSTSLGGRDDINLLLFFDRVYDILEFGV